MIIEETVNCHELDGQVVDGDEVRGYVQFRNIIPGQIFSGRYLNRDNKSGYVIKTTKPCAGPTDMYTWHRGGISLTTGGSIDLSEGTSDRVVDLVGKIHGYTNKQFSEIEPGEVFTAMGGVTRNLYLKTKYNVIRESTDTKDGNCILLSTGEGNKCRSYDVYSVVDITVKEA